MILSNYILLIIFTTLLIKLLNNSFEIYFQLENFSYWRYFKELL